ncbi:MAG: orotidine-5'-phosphate decarboxylase [archaeon]|jgi:orotidine-5'-phosphate decarboxylase|nr:orotidine-5'-phosphate decarboxylase [archaeon]
MNYVDLLIRSSDETKSIVCMGADPVLDRIPIDKGGIEGKITRFYEEILEACQSEGALPAAVKPNYAFYAQYGFDGLKALKKVCEKVKEKKIPLVLDAKRGDIGKSSAAYAREAFDFWEADCETIAPYMGTDSVMPFIEKTIGKEQGVYILNRTSNPGASDFQDIVSDGKKNFQIVSESIVKWSETALGNVGAVVGATSMEELGEVVEHFVKSGKQIPLLIPGVGAQGGSGADVAAALRKASYNLKLARINSSSGINYAYEKQETDDFAGAAAKAIKKLNEEIGQLE